MLTSSWYYTVPPALINICPPEGIDADPTIPQRGSAIIGTVVSFKGTIELDSIVDTPVNLNEMWTYESAEVQHRDI